MICYSFKLFVPMGTNSATSQGFDSIEFGCAVVFNQVRDESSIQSFLVDGLQLFLAINRDADFTEGVIKPIHHFIAMFIFHYRICRDISWVFEFAFVSYGFAAKRETFCNER